jgi:tight adherence protein C
VTGAVTALLMGGLVGAGVWLVVIGLLPVRRPLTDVLAAALAPPKPAPPLLTARPAQGWSARAGRPLVGFLAAFGLPRASVRADLAVLERPPQQHLAEQATAAVTGLVLGPAVALMTAAAGVALPWQIPVWGGLLLAVAGFFGPDVGVRADATARREEFRHALSAFLDLAVISLAGGAGVDGALDDAASSGTGWSFRQLRRALDTARLTSVPPWQTLGRLGHQLGVPELVELAASISLAGSEGAKVRASLAARAATLRAHALTDAEATAQSATERMSLPVVFLFGGFLIFVSYPAFQTVLTSL